MVAAFNLRIEKGYIIRFDFAGGVTPYEVGLGWIVELDKGDFVGREALIRRKEAGFKDKLVTITLEDGYVPPGADPIFRGGQEVGQTMSAAFGYPMGQAITLAYVPIELATANTKVEILDNGGTRHPAAVAQRWPYDPDGTRLRAQGDQVVDS
jgi:glycine cleavage system aminomethyltransferase T